MDRLRQAILGGNSKDAAEFTEQAIGSGRAPEAVMAALMGAMEIVGQEYERGDRFVPEMLVSAVAMKAALERLRPQLIAAGVPARGSIVIGTVVGDLHDVGKNLVCMMLEGGGFSVTDLGVDVSADRFVEAVRERKPDILAMSALLTTTMTEMANVIGELEAAGIRDQVKVMVGGAPVTQAYADEIGADGYSADAPGAASVARRFIGQREP